MCLIISRGTFLEVEIALPPRELQLKNGFRNIESGDFIDIL